MRSGPTSSTWGHVRLFSPWRYMIDAAARALLDRGRHWEEPDLDVISRPAASSSSATWPRSPRCRRCDRGCDSTARVVQVTRDGFDKMKTEGREERPFVLTVQTPRRERGAMLAKAVIDASGTTATPNPLGAAGVPAIGERALRRPHLLRHPRRARRRSRALRRPARPGRRQRPLRLQRLLDLVDLAG